MSCKMERLYSVDKILVYVGDDKEQCKEMIGLFLTTIPKEFEKLDNAIKKENWKKTYEIVHRIKPSIEILQIKNAVGAVAQLNANLFNKTDMGRIPELFAQIDKDIDNAIEQMKKDYSY